MDPTLLITTRVLPFIAIFVFSTVGFAHGNHSHSDSTNKKASKSNHHEESAFSLMLAVGAGYSKPLTNPPSSDPNAAEQKSVALHGGDDHSDHGGDTGTEASFGPYAMVDVGYKLTHKFSLDLSESVMLNGDGISDPALGISYTTPIAKSVRAAASLSATAPVSQASKDTYKITTVSLGGGPRFAMGKFSLGANASIAMSWYTKTVIVEDGQKPVSTSSPMLHGDDGDEPGGGDTMTMEGTGNREFNRYSLKALLGYKLTPSFRLDSNAGLSLVKKQFGDPFWSFDATILQISYMIL